MAKTISELRNQSIQVRDASAAGENTATRVGTVLNDIVGHIEDYENTQSSNNSSQDAKIEGVKSSLNAEIARAKTEESNLSTQIGTERTERQAAVSREETARIQADNDEKTARQQAYNAEQDARIKADNDEKTARENADITLRTMIQTEVSNRQIAVKQEEIRAMAAEKANAQAITDEVARAKAEEQANAQAITDEVARAKAAEKAIIFDVSAHNNGIVFESLQALLSSSNLSTLVPSSVRHGGMTIRFIQGSEQGSDNKYVQYRYMLSSTTYINFSNVANWQGVDDVPVIDSSDLIKSGGVAKIKTSIGKVIIPKVSGYYIKLSDGVDATLPGQTAYPTYSYSKIKVKEGDVVTITATASAWQRVYAFVDNSDKIIYVSPSTISTLSNSEVTVPANAAYIVINDNSNSSSYIEDANSVARTFANKQEQINELHKSVLGDEYVYETTIQSAGWVTYGNNLFLKKGYTYKFTNKSTLTGISVNLVLTDSSRVEIIPILGKGETVTYKLEYDAIALKSYVNGTELKIKVVIASLIENINNPDCITLNDYMELSDGNYIDNAINVMYAKGYRTIEIQSGNYTSNGAFLKEGLNIKGIDSVQIASVNASMEDEVKKYNIPNNVKFFNINFLNFAFQITNNNVIEKCSLSYNIDNSLPAIQSDNSLGNEQNNIIKNTKIDLHSNMPNAILIKRGCKNVIDGVTIVGHATKPLTYKNYGIYFYYGGNNNVIMNCTFSDVFVGILAIQNIDSAFCYNIIKNNHIISALEEGISFDTNGNNAAKIPRLAECAVTNIVEDGSTSEYYQYKLTVLARKQTLRYNNYGQPLNYDTVNVGDINPVGKFLQFDNVRGGNFKGEIVKIHSIDDNVITIRTARKLTDLNIGSQDIDYYTVYIDTGFYYNIIKDNTIESCITSISMIGCCSYNTVQGNIVVNPVINDRIFAFPNETICGIALYSTFGQVATPMYSNANNIIGNIVNVLIVSRLPNTFFGTPALPTMPNTLYNVVANNVVTVKYLEEEQIN